MKKTRIRYVLPRHIELYYLNNRYIGYLTFYEPQNDAITLSSMRMTHNSQRKGHGTTLMNAALKVHGHKKINVIARPHWDCDLPGLVRFFERFGFAAQRTWVDNNGVLMIRKPT